MAGWIACSLCKREGLGAHCQQVRTKLRTMACVCNHHTVRQADPGDLPIRAVNFRFSESHGSKNMVQRERRTPAVNPTRTGVIPIPSHMNIHVYSHIQTRID